MGPQRLRSADLPLRAFSMFVPSGSLTSSVRWASLRSSDAIRGLEDGRTFESPGIYVMRVQK